MSRYKRAFIERMAEEGTPVEPKYALMGEFRVRDCDGFRLIIFGPRDVAEARAGVPQGAIAVFDKDRATQDFGETLAKFLNVALAAAHGDNGPFHAMMPPKRPPTDCPSPESNP